MLFIWKIFHKSLTRKLCVGVFYHINLYQLWNNTPLHKMYSYTFKGSIMKVLETAYTDSIYSNLNKAGHFENYFKTICNRIIRIRRQFPSQKSNRLQFICIHIYTFVVNFNRKVTSCLPLMKARFEAGKSGTPNRSRLNAHSHTDWAIEDQASKLIATARDKWAFSPNNFTADWLSHLALAINMFVVVNFDALTQNNCTHFFFWNRLLILIIWPRVTCQHC